MTPTGWIWAALIGLYAVFFGWYTSFAGPLTDAEVEHYMALFAQNEPAPPPHELVHMRKWMEEDTGDDFVMVNIIHMRETPLQIEGVEPGETSFESWLLRKLVHSGGDRC